MKDDSQHLRAINLAEKYLVQRCLYRKRLRFGTVVWITMMVLCLVIGVLIEDISGWLRIAMALGFIGIMMLAGCVSVLGLPRVKQARQELADYREDHLTFLMN